MASPAPATTLSTTRYAFSALFLIFSGVGLYYLRIFPIQVGAPINFDNILNNHHLNVPFQHVKIPQRYIGIKKVDEVLALLVSAFSHGPLGLDEDAYWQQLHFLVGIFPMLAVWTVEAFRERNRGKLISYTSIWALFYQTVGGNIIIPLLNLCYILATRQQGYLRSGRSVPANVAEVLIPALLLGYLVPTVLMYLPFFSETVKLYLIAFWQPSPIFVNILIAIFSRQSSSSRVINKKAGSDIRHLKLLYIVCMMVAFLVHVFTISSVLLGRTGLATLASIFIPSQSQLLKSTGQDFHFIFQWDWLIIAISSITWAAYAIIEVQTELKALGIVSNLKGLLASLAIHLLLEGPGGAVAAVWWWRENALLEIERRTNEKTK